MIGSHENGKNGGGCDGSRLAAPKSLIGLGSVAGGQSVGLLGRNLNNSNNSRVVGGQQSSVGHSQASTATSSSIGVPLLCNLRPPTLGRGESLACVLEGYVHTWLCGGGGRLGLCFWVVEHC